MFGGGGDNAYPHTKGTQMKLKTFLTVAALMFASLSQAQSDDGAFVTNPNPFVSGAAKCTNNPIDLALKTYVNGVEQYVGQYIFLPTEPNEQSYEVKLVISSDNPLPHCQPLLSQIYLSIFNGTPTPLSFKCVL
jgi:hypothetical protein